MTRERPNGTDMSTIDLTKTRVRADDVTEPAADLWSNCLRVGDQIFVSGMTARAADGQTVIGEDEYEQAKVVFGKIKSLVERAGAAMDDVVKMTIFVTDITRNTRVWDARKEFFTGDFPACTLVEVSALAKPEILLEIEAIAIAGSSRA
jgi:enamine deaminase RidA (YjgF/YER057c/UK114 family)